MDAIKETAICSHCNKEVATSNLPMHEAHCKRFLCVCPDCDEQVPKDQLEEHRREAHTKIKCKMCNLKMERRKLPDHEANECTERLQNCEFCQLALPSGNLKEHLVACGSRTERCQDCNQYVMLKDQLQHSRFCAADDFKPTNPTPVSANTLQVDELEDSVVYEEPEDTGLSLSNLRKKKENKLEYIDQDQISTCPYCHLALPLNTLQWHKDKCRIFEGLRMSERMEASHNK